MRNFLVAERYARALSATYEQDEALEVVARVLRQFSRLLEQDPQLRRILMNPAIPSERRVAAMRDILGLLQRDVEAPAEHLAPLAQLLELLLRRNRLPWLSDVAKVTSAMANERLNRVGATITSAQPLDEAQAARVVAALETYSKKTVRADFEVDEEILGGLLVQMGTTLIDGSVRTRLARLRDSLLAEERSH